MTYTQETFFTIVLSILSSPGTAGLWDLIEYHTPENLFEIISKKNRPLTQEYMVKEYSSDPLKTAEAIIRRSSDQGISITGYRDSGYPALLKNISRPPLVLYSWGRLPEGSSIAMVGTRKSDVMSERIAGRLSSELVQNAYTIISGMAIGIDRASHIGALNAGGDTAGVLANGLDIVYPSGNRDLFRMIKSSEKSSLLSEYPPGVRPGRWTFVRRNRIISGLANGTVVVKAGIKSGALITARYAMEEGREVFACPGNTFDTGYEGCNRLIKNGAVIVTSVDDILNEIPQYVREKPEAVNVDKGEIITSQINSPELIQSVNGLDSIEKSVYDLISSDYTDVDSIIRKLDYSSSAVNEAVMYLELSGKILRDGNLVFRM